MARRFKSRNKITALLKVGVGADDAEYARVFEHWYFLLGATRLRITFNQAHVKGSFTTEVLDAQLMKMGESYLIIEAISGTFVGIISHMHARSFDGCLPVSGRLYHLIPMGRA